jgi:hypothetical protein
VISVMSPLYSYQFGYPLRVALDCDTDTAMTCTVPSKNEAIPMPVAAGTTIGTTCAVGTTFDQADGYYGLTFGKDSVYGCTLSFVNLAVMTRVVSCFFS